jgi:branched-chain amino acid transport system substrate-binding protein
MGWSAGFLVLINALTGCTGLINSPPHIVGTVRIAADLPLSGDDAPDGLPVRDAIALAIKQSTTVCGASSHQDACLRLELAAYDDVSKGIHDPAQGASNIRTMIADPTIVGMIGPLYDSVARSEIPVANPAGLPMISPANTDECLTQEPADGHCNGLRARLRPSGGNGFFRVVATRLSEAPAAAEFALRTLHKRHAFLVDEQTPTAHALVVAFASRFRAGGGMLAPSAQTADLVFEPGTDVTAIAASRKQLATAMPDLPFIGGDPLANDQYARAAGLLARGTYYTVVGVDPARVKAAATWIIDYRKAYGRDPGRLSLQAFDATKLLIQAIGRAIDDAGGSRPDRRQVLHEVAGTAAYKGLMGSIGFDSAGDTTLKLVSVYQWLAPTATSGEYVAQISVH